MISPLARLPFTLQDAYEEFKRILEKFSLEEDAEDAEGQEEDEEGAAAVAGLAKPTTSDADSDDEGGKYCWRPCWTR